MSKAFKSGLCAYCCTAKSSTGDHVIAKSFFPKDLRDNLPKVGACLNCNNRKSWLEHTLTTVMPFGARHSRAAETLLGVERKLAMNRPLHRQLSTGSRDVLQSINGSPWTHGMTVPFNSSYMEQLCEYIVKGLARHHWELNIGADTYARASFLTPEGAGWFDQAFAAKAKDHISCDLGQGVFRYEGILSIESPNLTLWRMSFYGAEVGGDPSALGQRVSMVYAVTAIKTSPVAKNLAAILGDLEAAQS